MHRRPAQRIAGWVLAGLAGLTMLAVIGWAIWRLPSLLYDYVPEPRDRAEAEASTRTAMIAGLAGLAALGGLAVTARTYQLAQQGQLTDRYSKAIEQLGDDKLDIRLGGIYALERLAVDSPRDHPTVVEVLSAFVRERTDPGVTARPSLADVLKELLLETGDDRHVDPASESSAGFTQLHERCPDRHAALTVLGRLPIRDRISRGDFRRADLKGAVLADANLAGATFIGANLFGAWFHRTDLTGADFSVTDLTGAVFHTVNLTGAAFVDADLSGALLQRANMARANLAMAKLGGATWDKATVWPQELRDLVMAESDYPAGPSGRRDLRDLQFREGFEVPLTLGPRET